MGAGDRKRNVAEDGDKEGEKQRQREPQGGRSRRENEREKKKHGDVRKAGSYKKNMGESKRARKEWMHIGGWERMSQGEKAKGRDTERELSRAR